MKLLITGGAGYIGAELISILPKSIQEVVVYDNLSRKNFNFFFGKNKIDNTEIKFIQGDILDSRKLENAMQGIDVVLHLAAKVTTPFANQHSHAFDQVNNWGTSEVVRIAELSNVKKFIYVSSTAVYGTSSKDEQFDVNSNTVPETYYSISKLDGENHVQRLISTPIKTYILRLGNVYGYSNSMRLDSVINKFMFEANFTNRLRIDGSGDQLRSFIHVQRLVENVLDVICEEIKPGVYNLVENVFSINSIVDTIKEIYPSLEMVFVNQNIKMRSLNVAPFTLRTTFNISFKEDLILLKEKYTF